MNVNFSLRFAAILLSPIFSLSFFKRNLESQTFHSYTEYVFFFLPLILLYN